jgi:iron complex transport system ATP-binding protein
MSTQLEVRNATVRRSGREILRRVSASLEQGKVHVLAGPNGSGKSTLLRLLCGLWRPDEGEVLIDGQPIHLFSRRQLARRVVLVPQEAGFAEGLTVEEAVWMGRYAHRSRWSPPGSCDCRAVERSLQLCDLALLRRRDVTTLSGGERQRVAVARGLAAEPDYLLLDEPTANLDVRHALEIFGLVRRLAASGQGVALATHELDASLRFADRVLLMDSGRCVFDGPASEAVQPARLEPVFRVRSELGRAPSGAPFLIFHPVQEEMS